VPVSIAHLPPAGVWPGGPGLMAVFIGVRCGGGGAEPLADGGGTVPAVACGAAGSVMALLSSRIEIMRCRGWPPGGPRAVGTANLDSREVD